MRNKLYWGIATLIIVIICAGVFSIILIEKQDTKPNRSYNTPSDEVLDNLRQKQDTETPETAEKPKPKDETINNGHWHDGEWHDNGHETPTQPAQVIPIATTNPIVNEDWNSRRLKADENWINSINVYLNYRKGKRTPEHIQNLSNDEKQKIVSELNRLMKQSDIARNKLDAILNEK